MAKANAHITIYESTHREKTIARHVFTGKRKNTLDGFKEISRAAALDVLRVINSPGARFQVFVTLNGQSFSEENYFEPGSAMAAGYLSAIASAEEFIAEVIKP